jgi:hypothetical protein
MVVSKAAHCEWHGPLLLINLSMVQGPGVLLLPLELQLIPRSVLALVRHPAHQTRRPECSPAGRALEAAGP